MSRRSRPPVPGAGKSGNSSMAARKTPIRVQDVVGAPLYSHMKKYLMSTQDLEHHGFPRKDESYKGSSGVATIKHKVRPDDDTAANRNGPSLNDPCSRVCNRCRTSFLVTPDGFPRNQEICKYHTGRLCAKSTTKTRGSKPQQVSESDKKYTCCDGDPSRTHCRTAPSHVFLGKTEGNFEGFVSASLPAGDAKTMGSHPWDIIALDCEMIYTTQGRELARVTVVGQDKNIRYDTFVKPCNPVVDYNTHYSGIQPDMIESCKKSLSHVHRKILENLKPNSIIIGHGLENDLIALKLIHDCVIDTTLLYPHSKGLPFKRALRILSKEYLGKEIQAGDGGHSSHEDANATFQLVIHKILWDARKPTKIPSLFEQM